MTLDLPPPTQSDWFRDFERREWVARMDDHHNRYMREREAAGVRPEVIRRAIWGEPQPEAGRS